MCSSITEGRLNPIRLSPGAVRRRQIGAQEMLFDIVAVSIKVMRHWIYRYRYRYDFYRFIKILRQNIVFWCRSLMLKNNAIFIQYKYFDRHWKNWIYCDLFQNLWNRSQFEHMHFDLCSDKKYIVFLAILNM